MGLGKTVQALAHILVEKREGRLDRPCLVVCPTSVVPNWQAEAARFAPELRVLSLHGADRARPLRRDRQQRSGADDLRAAAARRRAAAAGAVASRGARRGAGDQERRDEGDNARLQARRAAPAVPDRHAGREPSRRIVVAIRLSDAGAARRCETLYPRVPHADRKEERRRAAGGTGVAAEAVSAAPDQGSGRPRAAAENRDRSARSNWPGRSAISTRPCGSRCTKRCARKSPRRALRAAAS